MIKATLAVIVLCLASVAMSQPSDTDEDQDGGYVHEDLRSTRLPDGRFVNVGVDIDSDTGYQCAIFAPDGKTQKVNDATKMWAGDFLPCVVCGIDNDHLLVLGEATKNSREARVFDLQTGKMSGLFTMPLGHIRTLERLTDGVLLAHDWGVIQAVSTSGKPLWKRSQIPGPNGTTTSMAHVDAIRVMPDGRLCALEDQEKRVVILDKDLRYLSEISLKAFDKFWPTQEIGAAKDGVWLQDSVEGGLVEIGFNGKVLRSIPVPKEDGAEDTWIHFVGTTASGAPVYDSEMLYWVRPDGTALGFGGAPHPHWNLSKTLQQSAVTFPSRSFSYL